MINGGGAELYTVNFVLRCNASALARNVADFRAPRSLASAGIWQLRRVPFEKLVMPFSCGLFLFRR
jgi:hypothetical protein